MHAKSCVILFPNIKGLLPITGVYFGEKLETYAKSGPVFIPFPLLSLLSASVQPLHLADYRPCSLKSPLQQEPSLPVTLAIVPAARIPMARAACSSRAVPAALPFYRPRWLRSCSPDSVAMAIVGFEMLR